MITKHYRDLGEWFESDGLVFFISSGSPSPKLLAATK